MTYLLDTNVVSEPIRPRPEVKVLAWLAARNSGEVFVSAATVAEIRYGIDAIADGSRRRTLERWYVETFEARSERVIPADLKVADAWGRLRRRAQAVGRTMSLMDALIAATAHVHGLTLVTRNVRDFEAWGGPILDPWHDL